MKVKANALLEGCNISASQGAYGIAVIPGDDGWAIWSRSGSQVSITQVKLPATAFPDGYVKGEEGFAVKQSFFPDALIPGTEPDITVAGGKLTVVTDKRKQTSRLEGGDPNEYVRNMPSYVPEATMAVASDDLTKFFKQKQIKDFKNVNGVKLTLTEEGLKAEVADETTSFEDFLPSDAVVVPEGGVHARFNVDMLIPMITCMPKGALVTLGFSMNAPIELIIATENVEARVLLAPLIVEEDEMDG